MFEGIFLNFPKTKQTFEYEGYFLIWKFNYIVTNNKAEM